MTPPNSQDSSIRTPPRIKMNKVERRRGGVEIQSRTDVSDLELVEGEEEAHDLLALGLHGQVRRGLPASANREAPDALASARSARAVSTSPDRTAAKSAWCWWEGGGGSVGLGCGRASRVAPARGIAARSRVGSRGHFPSDGGRAGDAPPPPHSSVLELPATH